MSKRFRIADKDSIPTHFEAIPLRAPWRGLGLIGGALALAGGLILVGSTDGRPAELIGPLAAIAGLTLLIATLRLGRAETTVGTARIECRIGPLRQLVPSGSVVDARARPASGWRRLYARDEIVARSEIASRPIVIPSTDATALLAAIREVG